MHGIRSFLQVGFCSQCQLINIVWYSTDFYPFSWSKLHPQCYLKKLKTSFSSSSYSEKMWGVKVELKPHYLLFCGFIFLCVQLPKNITKWFLFVIIHNFSIHFAINLFYLYNLKTLINYGTTTASCMWMNEIKAKTKSHQFRIDHVFNSSI